MLLTFELRTQTVETYRINNVNKSISQKMQLQNKVKPLDFNPFRSVS